MSKMLNISSSSISKAILPKWGPHPKLKPIILGFRKPKIEKNENFHFNLKSSQSKWFGNSYSGVKLEFCMRPNNNNGDKELISEEEEERRRNSTMPDRFRYLTKEVPSPPFRWSWLLVLLPFAICAWRTVLWELSHWKNILTGIFKFVGYLMKLTLALIYSFIGDPISYAILFVESTLYAIRSLYSSIVTSTPIPELTLVMMLASLVLSIGEVASPNSINSQPYMLAFAGLIGYGVVKGVIMESFFWAILIGIFCFSRFFKKRDYVSSVLPVATILASVGEVWVRILVITSFTMLAIHKYSKDIEEGYKEDESSYSGVKAPCSLFAVALAIGLRVAAKWAGYRHLTWMIV